jgi:hypothetical protein
LPVSFIVFVEPGAFSSFTPGPQSALAILRDLLSAPNSCDFGGYKLEPGKSFAGTERSDAYPHIGTRPTATIEAMSNRISRKIIVGEFTY